MARERVVWGVLIVLLAGFSVWCGSGVLLAMALGALVAPVLSLWACRAAARQLECGLFIGPSALRSRPATGTLQVRNTGRLPVTRAVCRVRCKNHYTGQTADFDIVFSAGPGQVVKVPFDFACVHCGRVSVHAAALKTTDHFGVLSCTVPAGAACSITVLPDTFSTAVTLPGEAYSTRQGEDDGAQRPGVDYSETLWLRDYRQGDGLRSIHWKLSGKMDRLIVREGVRPVDDRLLVLCETPGPDFPGRVEACDAVADVVFSLSQALAAQGVAHQVGWQQGDEGSVRLVDVDVPEDVIGSLPRILAEGRDPAWESCAAAFMEAYTPADYSRIVYIGFGFPPQAEAMADETRLTAILCQDKDNPGPDMGGMAMTFTPQHYRHQLAHIVL